MRERTISSSPSHRTPLGLAAILMAAALALASCGGGPSKRTGSTASTARTPHAEGTNVVRISGKSPADVASAAILAVYPDQAHQPRGLVLTPQDDWRHALVAAPFAADPVDGAILPTARDYLPVGPSDLVSRLDPPGFPRAQGLQALVLGRTGDDVIRALQDRGLHLTVLKAPTVPDLTFKAVPYRGGWAHVYSDQIVVISDEARDYSIPAAAWSAFSGDTVVFVHRDGVPNATRQVLAQREKLRLQKPTMYLIGPPTVIPDAIATQLAAYGPVKRVAGPTAAATAVALARYKDRKTGFGWGLRRGPANVSLVDPRDWGNSFGAIALAAAGPRAPVLLSDGPTSIPPEAVRYLRELGNSQGNQGFVLGDEASIGKGVFAALDQVLAPGSPRKG